MRYTLLIIAVCLLFTACKKDKFTTAPQISFKSVNPNAFSLNLPITGQALPVLTIGVTDAEGDLGFKDGKDTTMLYIKNLLTGKTDSSLYLPDIATAAIKDFQGDIQITLSTSILLEGSTRPSPKTDTLYYEIYIKDFAKNKSNVIKTADPVFAISR
jgi:hypothetical protein